MSHLTDTTAPINVPPPIAAGPTNSSAAATNLDELRRRVIAITYALYPGDFDLETSCDPEYPSETWEVITVTVPDSPTLLAHKNEWHRQVIDALGDEAWRFTLCVFPVAK